MNNRQLYYKQVAVHRFGRAADVIWAEQEVANNTKGSNRERRSLIWWMKNRAAEHMQRLEFLKDTPLPDYRTLACDLVAMQDVIGYLASNPSPTAVDRHGKKLLRFFEATGEAIFSSAQQEWHAEAARLLSTGFDMSDILATTRDWEMTNDRRIELFERELSGERLSAAESDELDHLQRIADVKRGLAMSAALHEVGAVGAESERDQAPEE